MKALGFSLIELMVVVAIIAVLASVAVPAYKSYLLKTKMAHVINAMDILQEKSILYSQQHGGFATAYNLGLTTTLNAGHVDEPSGLLPDTSFFLQPILMSDNDFPACGRFGIVQVSIDPYVFGFPEAIQGSGYMFIFSYFYNVNGIIKTFRFYNGSFGGAHVAGGDYISGAVNAYLSDGTDNPVFTAAIADINSNAVCQ